MRVLVVDDHPIFAMGLERLLESSGHQVCGHATSVAEALRLLETTQPDVVVLDLSLPDGSGLQVLRRPAESGASSPPTVVVSMHDEELFARRSIESGARGYLTKETAPARIVEAIETVARGGLFVSDRVKQRLFLEHGRGERPATGSAAWIARLSNREVEVFQLLGRGLGTKQVAGKLAISVKTVEAHQARIKRKLGLSSMAQLIRAAAIWTEDPRARPLPEAEE